MQYDRRRPETRGSSRRERRGEFAEGPDSCTICLAAYQEEDWLRRLPCYHRFHRGCIDRWLQGNSSCPLCKQPVRV
jgi:hypothetical protein